jgi:hypothetical protein
MSRRGPAAASALIVLAVCGQPAAAQPPAAPQATAQAPRLRVFLDCDECFNEYLRNEIKWVDFVRQPQDADVHLLSSSRETGGGGREYVLRFVGLGRFSGVDQELRALSLTGEPEDLRRRGVLQAVSVALLGYLAREGLPASLTLNVRPAEAAETEPARDPWNFWVFNLRAGGSADAEESNRQVSWNVRASADRVTNEWIVSFGARTDEETEHFKLVDPDEDEPLKVTRRERSFDWFAAKSLGEHWSLGFAGAVESSTFGNTRLEAWSAPAIEANLFPYAQYAARQLRLQYTAGTRHARYNEETLFGKLRETHAAHELSATLDQRQPWGSLQVSTQFSQYLHDRSKYRLEVDGELSFRIRRGLSISLDGSASRIRDQISLPRRDATPEEVLLRLRQLQSGYQVDFSASISYSFGSIFNNIVNPRFGR